VHIRSYLYLRFLRDGLFTETHKTDYLKCTEASFLVFLAAVENLRSPDLRLTFGGLLLFRSLILLCVSQYTVDTWMLWPWVRKKQSLTQIGSDHAEIHVMETKRKARVGLARQYWNNGSHGPNLSPTLGESEPFAQYFFENWATVFEYTDHT